MSSRILQDAWRHEDLSGGGNQAYRKLARKHHPDGNPGDKRETKFKEINEAYEVLGDPQNARNTTNSVNGRATNKRRRERGQSVCRPWSGGFGGRGGAPGAQAAVAP